MNLTVYLLREGVSTLDSLEPEEGYEVLTPSAKLPFPCLAWVQANRPKPPKWGAWLGSAFAVQALGLTNQSNSFVLFLEVEGRIFATTFGYGFNALDRALIEPDFGLKVTLNEVDPEALDTLDTRRVDRVSRQRRTHLNVGRGVRDFDISTDMDWIRAVSGKPIADSFARKLMGSDSLKLSMDCSVPELGDRCRELLKTYRKKNYQKNFDFIDHLRPLKQQDPLVSELEEKLKLQLKTRDREWVSIALPEMPIASFVSWRISSQHQREDYDDLGLEQVYHFLETHPDVPTSPTKIRLRGRDAEGNEPTHRDTLHQYLVSQVDYKGRTYVLSLGQWFRVDKNYISQIRQKASQIPDITHTLQLPEWTSEFKDEEEYNAHAGRQKKWLVLDRKPLYLEKPQGKVEVSDLLSLELDFVHVKDMKDSATLSHLFSQGSVSARLLKLDSTYADKVKALFQSHYGSKKAFDPNKDRPRVVYAIATSKPGALADTLFFFSIVNLLKHVDDVRMAGCDVALCRIERREEARPPSSPPKRSGPGPRSR